MRRISGSVEVALGEQRDRLTGARNTRLPKGKRDPGESLAEAAAREVLEETGFTARVKAPLGSVSYTYREGPDQVAKEVHFFLMCHSGGDPEQRDGELERVFWCPLASAPERLTYASERDVVSRAREILEP